MNIKNFFDEELKSTLIHAAAGVIVGFISFMVNQPVWNFFIMLAILGALIMVMKTAMKIQKPFKWWLGNGIIVYIFIWLVTWTIFYNIRLFG